MLVYMKDINVIKIFSAELECIAMQALIFSDSHRGFSYIYDTVVKYPKIDLIIHAGDVQADVDDILSVFPRIPCAYVLGNNDFSVWDVPYDRFFEFGGKKIFLTHGHNYGVKMSPRRVTAKAKQMGADVCIFGHTHVPYLDECEILTINPGTARRGYALLTVENGTVRAELKSL